MALTTAVSEKKVEAADGVDVAEADNKSAGTVPVLPAVSEEAESHPVTPVQPDVDRRT